MPLDATDFGYVSILRDEPSPGDSTNVKVGGASCVWGYATSSMNPGDIVIVDTAADYSYKTTTSASQTTVAGFVVAHLEPGMKWNFSGAIVSGDKILVVKAGRVAAKASTAISRGALVGTSTTAGYVVTTTTQDAGAGRAVTAASTLGDTIYVDVSV